MKLIAEKKYCFAALLLLVAGLMIGRISHAPWTSEAFAQERGFPAAAFKSGAQRSEVILQEISDTLKRMEGTLQRMEEAGTAHGR